jgi:uncharacterized protein (TIGR02117 family)
MASTSRPWYVRLLRIFLKILIGLIAFVVLYLGFAWAMGSLTSNSDFKSCSGNCYTVYILSNGVHTDIVVPVTSDVMDWKDFADPKLTKSGDSTYTWVGFGWGDKGFYLDTPEWSDLKVSTALTAMFYLGTSAMHVTFHHELKESELCKKVSISKQQYEEMILYIKDGFMKSSDENFQLIPNASYGQRDLFFEGSGAYSLFYTCNTWANGCLKAGGLKACVWTPYDKSILSKYQ